jgi:hypothetical protein
VSGDLGVAVEVESGLVDLPDGVLAHQEAMATWAVTPTFATAGRTAWTPLEAPVGPWRALKLKGLGVQAADGPHPPSVVPYRREHAHVGLDDAGELRMVESAPAPTGGLLLARAQAEHDAGVALTRAGVPAIAPLRVYRYRDPGLRFSTPTGPEPLGLVLSAAPAALPFRADALFTELRGDAAPAEAGFAERLRNGEPRLAVLAALGRSYGRALRGFAEAGWFRHSASLDNWAYAPELGCVYLSDLDSSRPLAGHRPERRALELVRDLAGPAFHVATQLVSPRHRASFSGEEIAALNPFTAAAAGYYPDRPAAAVGWAGRAFLSYYLPLHERGERMDRALVYCLLMRALLPLHLADPLGEAHPYPPGVAGFEARCAAFLGPQRWAEARRHLARAERREGALR